MIETSEASGLWRLKPEERDALGATSYGTGELIRHAAKGGARSILLGLGGSAMTDGGAGMAAALGFEMFDHADAPYDLQHGNLLEVASIQSRHAISLPKIIAASDVQNPLLGPRGTAQIFSPQKGADAHMIEILEAGLRHFAEVVQRDLGNDFRETPGAGAAGGLGFGLLSFCSAELRSGFEILAEMLDLEALV